MASRLTVRQIKDQALALADLTDSDWADNERLIDWINAEAAVLYSALVLTFEDYFYKRSTIALVNGQDHYQIPVDLWKPLAVWWMASTTDANRFRLPRITKDLMDTPDSYYPPSTLMGSHLGYFFTGQEIWVHPDPNGGGVLEIWYVPDLSRVDADNDVISFHVPVVWEDYLPLAVATRLAVVEGSDEAGGLKALRDEVFARIRASATDRDAGEGQPIADKRGRSRS